MPIFNSDRINDRLKTISPATPSENVPKGLYTFNVVSAQRGRDNKNDVYLKLELKGLNAPKEARAYTFGKLFKTASNEGRAEQELSDFLAAADAMGFTAEQIGKMELEELVGHQGIVGIEEAKNKDGSRFTTTGFGAWFRMDAPGEITWNPRSLDDDSEPHQQSQQEIADNFRNRGRDYNTNNNRQRDNSAGRR